MNKPENLDKLTFYDLRKFITALKTFTEDKEMKKLLTSILKILRAMEIKNKPVPVVTRSRKKSPALFKLK